MKLRVTARANRDLIDIADFIGQENPVAAQRVGARIRRAFDLLTTAPRIGRQIFELDIREFPIPGLPFLIVYRVTDDAVEILTIFHAARDPSTKLRG